jgi:hypothetical protein
MTIRDSGVNKRWPVYQGIIMAKHTNDITRARTYTLLTSPRSFMDAAARRAADLARNVKKSQDASDVARWEDEAGATKPRAQGLH